MDGAVDDRPVRLVEHSHDDGAAAADDENRRPAATPVAGSLIYDHPTDFLDTIAVVVEGQVRPQRTIKAEYRFHDAATAFIAARQVPGKTVIHFEDAGDL